jgi:hypothetical protein
VQFAIDDFPAGQFAEQGLHFIIGQFFCGHVAFLRVQEWGCEGFIMSRPVSIGKNGRVKLCCLDV